MGVAPTAAPIATPAAPAAAVLPLADFSLFYKNYMQLHTKQYRILYI